MANDIGIDISGINKECLDIEAAHKETFCHDTSSVDSNNSGLHFILLADSNSSNSTSSHLDNNPLVDSNNSKNSGLLFE
jgi:hypothetical protein